MDGSQEVPHQKMVQQIFLKERISVTNDIQAWETSYYYLNEKLGVIPKYSWGDGAKDGDVELDDSMTNQFADPVVPPSPKQKQNSSLEV